jgi:hypothetical protein
MGYTRIFGSLILKLPLTALRAAHNTARSRDTAVFPGRRFERETAHNAHSHSYA